VHQRQRHHELGISSLHGWAHHETGCGRRRLHSVLRIPRATLAHQRSSKVCSSARGVERRRGGAQASRPAQSIHPNQAVDVPLRSNARRALAITTIATRELDPKQRAIVSTWRARSRPSFRLQAGYASSETDVHVYVFQSRANSNENGQGEFEGGAPNDIAVSSSIRRRPCAPRQAYREA